MFSPKAIASNRHDPLSLLRFTFTGTCPETEIESCMAFWNGPSVLFAGVTLILFVRSPTAKEILCYGYITYLPNQRLGNKTHQQNVSVFHPMNQINREWNKIICPSSQIFQAAWEKHNLCWWSACACVRDMQHLGFLFLRFAGAAGRARHIDSASRALPLHLFFPMPSAWTRVYT